MVRNPPCNTGDLGLVSSPGTLFRELRAHMPHGMAKLEKKKSLMKAKIHASDCNRIFCALGNPEKPDGCSAFS